MSRAAVSGHQREDILNESVRAVAPAAHAARDVIAVRRLSKTYGTGTDAVDALRNIDFIVADGEFMSIVGPSGCGKSTLLKMLAGLMPASGGEALLNDVPIAGPRRDIGVVFQSPVLFPWRTVLGNVLLPVDVQKLDLTSLDSVRQAADEIRSEHDTIDLLINNADRKGGHILKDTHDKLWLIDHGICFNTQPKLRTVVWDFGGQAIPDRLFEDLADFRQRLDDDDDLQEAFASLLSAAEVQAVRRRADRLLAARKFPEPGPGRNYPWPPL